MSNANVAARGASRGPIRVDATRWPLVVITFTGQQGDGDVEGFIGELAALYQRGLPFMTLSHLNDYSSNMAHVSRLGAWSRDNRELFRQWCRGSALVASSSSFRFLLSTYHLISRLPYPYLICETEAEANVWLAEQARVAGLSIPGL